jgi:hypothetical protein
VEKLSQLGRATQSPIPKRRATTPCDHFLHSKPWQYGVTHDTTQKFRVVVERMRRLARTLARFDRTGNCRAIFPAVNTILTRLREAEANYAEGQRFKWSRRTVFRYLDRLQEKGIATPGGLSTYHGTRRRGLHPDRLLLRPEKCGTPTSRKCVTSTSEKSGTQKILRSKNLHPPEEQSHRQSEPNQNQKLDDDSHLAGKDFSKPTPKSSSNPLGSEVPNQNRIRNALPNFER